MVMQKQKTKNDCHFIMYLCSSNAIVWHGASLIKILEK